MNIPECMSIHGTPTDNIARQPLTTAERRKHQRMAREQGPHSPKSQTILEILK